MSECSTDGKKFAVPSFALGEPQPVNIDHIISFEKEVDDSYRENEGKQQIRVYTADPFSKVPTITWKFKTVEQRDSAYENLKCALCFHV